MTRHVSLSELAADGIQLRPAEAAAVVAELCRQHSRGEIRGIPAPGIIRVNRDGGVIAQGPMTGDDEGVARAGHLLNDLMPDADAPAAYRASGGLRLVIARALGILDLPPYSGLDEFRGALVRFAGPDPVATLRGLFERWEPALVASGPPALVPPGPQPATALAPSIPHGMAPTVAPVPSRNRPGRLSSSLGLGVAALLALGALGMAVGSAQQDRPARAEAPVANRLSSQPPLAGPQRPAPVRKARTVATSAPMPAASAARASAARPRARQARQPRREVARETLRAAALEPRREAAPEPSREADYEPGREADPEPRRETVRRPSFFKRELFRIKIK